MPTAVLAPRRVRTPAAWLVVALAFGGAAGWLDMAASDVQVAVLVLLVAGFAVTLPGRASAVVAGVACGLGLTLFELIAAPSRFSPFTLLAVLPGMLGAFGGSIAGRFLQSASDTLSAIPADAEARSLRRPLGTRLILAVALTVVAVATLRGIASALRAVGHPLAVWLSLCWQAATYAGWILLTRLLLEARERIGARCGSTNGTAGVVTGAEAVVHAVLVCGLVSAHALLLVTITFGLFIPLGPGGASALLGAAWRAYVLPDVLAYALIIGLAFASDGRRRIRELAQREQMLRREAADARLAALRAQLNPHFLYNTLNSAIVLARGGQAQQTATVLEGLTEMLRYALDEVRPVAPVRDELAFITRYLDIQQVRFGARLRATVRCDNASAVVAIPVLLLQPLVENAVEHGIGALLSGGHIAVTASSDESVLTIVVENDGPPFEVASTVDAPGIGLRNTRARLESVYGARASLTFAARVDGGVRATLHIRLGNAP